MLVHLVDTMSLSYVFRVVGAGERRGRGEVGDGAKKMRRWRTETRRQRRKKKGHLSNKYPSCQVGGEHCQDYLGWCSHVSPVNMAFVSCSYRRCKGH